RGVPLAVTLAGGYAPDVRDAVDINAATIEVVARRSRRGSPRSGRGAPTGGRAPKGAAAQRAV
ncbi:MAG: hypothetical protein HZB46_07450, partial [Solirubrobacterales bacterium]|nr:hypothetical protein [Solirubrobacterales bacterium]